MKKYSDMIPERLINRIFEAASIQRWNDHVRPVELTELDKQAHKMVIAWVLAKYQQESWQIDWTRLMEAGLFEFLHRVVLTDIKPPVFHYLMKKAGRQLNAYVLSELEDDLSGIKSPGSGRPLHELMSRYLFEPDYSRKERYILNASHYLATKWEFELVYHAYPNMYGIQETKQEIEDKIEDYYQLTGVQKILLGGKSHHFIDLVSQLRFQKRWSKTPRIPQTSVLGHMLVVAQLTYLMLAAGLGPRGEKRLYNDFFSALIHDLPEVYTRDIISPVKREVKGLDQVILEYERRKLEDKILPLLPDSWHGQIVYFLDNQFCDRYQKGGRTLLKQTSGESGSEGTDSPEALRFDPAEFEQDRFNPVDGRLIKIADELAAFWEAGLSIAHGIRSPNLKNALEKLHRKHKDDPQAAPLFDKAVFERMAAF